MQLLSCICDVLAIFFRELRSVARIIDLLADIVYCLYVSSPRGALLDTHFLDCLPLSATSTHFSLLRVDVTLSLTALSTRVQACMQAQTHHELTLHPTSADYGSAGSGAISTSDRAGLLTNQPAAVRPWLYNCT